MAYDLAFNTQEDFIGFVLDNGVFWKKLQQFLDQTQQEYRQLGAWKKFRIREHDVPNKLKWLSNYFEALTELMPALQRDDDPRLEISSHLRVDLSRTLKELLSYAAREENPFSFELRTQAGLIQDRMQEAGHFIPLSYLGNVLSDWAGDYAKRHSRIQEDAHNALNNPVPGQPLFDGSERDASLDTLPPSRSFAAMLEEREADQKALKTRSS